MSENYVTELSSKKHKTIQILSGLALVVLIGLSFFRVFGAGIPLYLVFGFVNILLTLVFTDIFIRKEGFGRKLKDVQISALMLVPAVLICFGLSHIGLAAFGFINAMSLCLGIQLFLMGMFNLLRFLNENLLRSENNFLKLFYKTENTTLAISILTCLSLSVMVLCGYCDLVFAISFGTPLLGVSLILKLGMFLYDRYKKGKQQTKIVLTDNSNDNKNPGYNFDLNNLNNNKDDLGNNQFPAQDNDNEKNKKTNLNDPSG